MDLTFKELQKRDVINIVDGKCLGNITDLKLSFPNGKLVGIVVPGKKLNFFLKLFDKSSLFIDQSQINKIGGDVILVTVNCGDDCAPFVKGNKPKPCNPCSPCLTNEEDDE